MQMLAAQSFIPYVLPPVLLTGALLVAFVACEYYTDRRKRRELYRLWQSEHSGVPASEPSDGAIAEPARAYFTLRHLQGYSLAVLFVGLALGFRLLLEPTLEGRLPYTFFLVPVLLTGLSAGLWETLLSLVLGFLAAEWFVIEPRGSLVITGAHGWLGGMLYFLIGLGIVLFMEFARLAGQRTLKSDIAYFKRLKELDEERAHHEKTQAVRLILGSIVDSLPDAVLGLTPQGEIMIWNGAAERLLGFPAREAVGQPLALLVPPERHAEEQKLLEQVSRGEHVEGWSVVLNHKSHPGVRVLLTVSPAKDKAGKLVGAFVTLRQSPANL